MDKIRLGIIGLGGMGRQHAHRILAGKVPRVELAAVCDTDVRRLEEFPANVRRYSEFERMLAEKTVDSVLIVTPHYSHTTIGIAALESGLHVLVEKPISVHRLDAERLIAAHRNPGQVFAAMFQMRTQPVFRTIRQLVQNSGLGKVCRVLWVATAWFRTQAYYSSGGWRATWAGEGGGVLLNQCPHNLDLYQWIFGMPKRVIGLCQFGRYHTIEVEDDVTAYFEHEGGMHGTFIASTGEAPGTDRLEVAMEGGRIVYENDRLTLLKNDVSMTEFARTSPKFFDRPPAHEVVLPTGDPGEQHGEILRNFADAILDGVPVLAPAAEGLRSVELANSIILSAWTGQPVNLPIDGVVYARLLKEKAAGSQRS